MEKTKVQSQIHLKGCFRIQLEEDGKIVGDSGWNENNIMNDGFNEFIVKTLGAIAGSDQITHINVGTGGTLNVTATALSGEVVGTGGVVIRASVTAASSSSSKTLRLTATLSSANSFVTQTENISNVGLFGHSTTNILFAGNTFNSSSCATNQNLNLTYDITMS